MTADVVFASAGPAARATSRVEVITREPGFRATSCPDVPTVYTLNDALFAQFAVIRSVAVRTWDYGSGGRGFESLPARKRPATAL